jgi:RNA polymerase sigma-70 factor, ECF subfamily
VSETDDRAWIELAVKTARPQALGALLRYFRDLDIAEEAFQEACLRALTNWPRKGRPRDPAAWLIWVGRNAAIDELRRRKTMEALPDDFAAMAVSPDAMVVDRLDESAYRDDILRLLFTCCHPDLPVEQQIALALRIVSGLSVIEIARAFLISESAAEQRITRAKRRITDAGLPFETPGPAERAARVSAVAAMIYLLFNEGYSASGGTLHMRLPLCDEAIRLSRLLLGLFPDDCEVMGLTALLLLQHARAAARLDADQAIVLLEDQDRRLWDRKFIAEGLVLVDKALRHQRAGPFQLQAAIAAAHARATHAAETDWKQIEHLYTLLETLQPSPVVTLNRSVAVAKVHGPAAALALIEPLADRLARYFHFHGVKGALLTQLGRPEEARAAFNQAIALARTPAEAAHIRLQLDHLLDGLRTATEDPSC